MTRRLHLRGVNWLGDGTLAEAAARGLDVHARVRSSRSPAPARLGSVDGDIVVELGDSESGVAPGQACVFYDSEEAGARVLGGGWIERAERTGEAEIALRKLITQPAAVA
jgi:tRNA-specific 2-thiouridylase